MHNNQERRPQKGSPHREVVTNVMRRRVLAGHNDSVGVHAGHHKRCVARSPLIFKLQIMVKQKGVDVGVVPDAVSMEPGVHDGKGQHEQQDQYFWI